MPFLATELAALLRATGGVDGGLTADQLSAFVHEPIGRVRMTLRRMLDEGEVFVTQGDGPTARFLLTSMRSGPHRPPPPPNADDFGWGRTDTSRKSWSGRPSWDDPHVELARLRDEVARLHQDNAELRMALQRSRPLPDEGLRGRLDDLIKLCHPDRHDNSERSNAITQWLLSLRKR